MFVKPTDSPTYLNRRSYHDRHVFKSLPFSQFRRAVVVCSDASTRQEAVDYMYGKFLKCGYSKEELDTARVTALSLNREQILGLTTSRTDDQQPITSHPPSSPIPTVPAPRSLTFVSVFSCYTPHLKELVNSLKQDIKMLTGTDKIIFANKKNPITLLHLCFVNLHFQMSYQ